MKTRIFDEHLNRENFFTPDEIDTFLTIAYNGTEKKKTKTRERTNITYYDTPASFDIETTSFYDHEEKRAVMYAWMLGINGAVLLGRSWEEWDECYKKLVSTFGITPKNRLIVYVHNLAYDFQFLRKHQKWDAVFCIDERKPVYAITKEGVEFRCSYILTGLSLENLAGKLKRHEVTKLVGNLDYEKIRTPETPLTEEEKAYCINDVKVVMAYIAEQIEEEGGIHKIPLTNTGYVRRETRNVYMGNWKWKELIAGTKLDVSEYDQLVRAFLGGFTHASAITSDITLENVTSYDFTSSYPAVMCSEKFPIGKSKIVKKLTRKDFEDYLKYYCCLFDVELTGLEATFPYEHYISESKCTIKEGVQADNGRIVKANKIITTVTEQDFSIIRRVYKWDTMRVANFRIYRKAYLPKAFIEFILQLYKTKTALKGVIGREEEYNRAKALLNSLYGMIVTAISKPEIAYDGELNIWADPKEANKTADIDDYNGKFDRFLYYPWGVWITAYARKNLWTAILALKEDYHYSDTDSVKITNAEAHETYFERYNQQITEKLKIMCDIYNIDFNLTCPETIKGEKKPLGVWDFDGKYDKFKTLGAKRYMTLTGEKLQITVAGLGKKSGAEYFVKNFTKDEYFEEFKSGLYVPAEYTGKKTHTYIDDTHRGIMTDYMGNEYKYEELSGIHLSPQPYELTLSAEYDTFLSTLHKIY